MNRLRYITGMVAYGLIAMIALPWLIVGIVIRETGGGITAFGLHLTGVAMFAADWAKGGEA
jgi:hypothetical protein